MTKLDKLFVALDSSLDREPSTVTLYGRWKRKNGSFSYPLVVGAFVGYDENTMELEDAEEYAPTIVVSKVDISEDEGGTLTFTCKGIVFTIEGVKKTEHKTSVIW